MSSSFDARRSRRALLRATATAVAVVAFASCEVAARPAKRIPRLGYMTGPSSSETTKQLLEAFRGGLREHGYVEGKTVQVELRYSEGRPEELDEFAAEFVGMPVDVIVTPATTAAQRAAIRATKTIPIVMTMLQDPVASGLVHSLARPGGNVTGGDNTLDASSGKRLELLRELVPGTRRVGAIWDGNVDRAGAQSLKGAHEAARELNVEVIELVVGSRSDLAGALKLATNRGVDALLVGAVPFYITELRREIADYALERRIPLASDIAGDWVEAGGLVAVGHSQLESVRRLAYFVDRILKGTKAGELPIERPARFELVVNLKTAQALGLTVPQSVLSRATKVIQ